MSNKIDEKFPYSPPPCDKSGYGDGPWQREPDSEAWTDIETGYRCGIIRHPKFGSLGGYVRVPDNHPLAGKSYSARATIPAGWMERHVNIDQDVGAINVFCASLKMTETEAELCLLLFCHGGLTYGDDGWLGFDCGHAGDLQPGIKYMLRQAGVSTRINGDVYREFPYVKAQCTRLAKQIWEYEYAMRGKG